MATSIEKTNPISYEEFHSSDKLRRHLSESPLLELLRSTQEHCVAFIATTDNKSVGVVLAYVNEDREFYIECLEVVENYRRKGIGRQLLKNIEESGKKEGCEKLSLQVDRKNVTAIDLYKKLGFKRQLGHGMQFHKMLKKI